jgi:DnaJ-class molecular chaperone
MDNLYSILNIENTASQDEIKKAYRKLSMTWHPDRNKTPEATEKFKEISTAYAVLSDPTKRAEYDRKKDGFDMSSLNIPDIFKVFMGGQNGPGSGPMGMGMGMPFGFPPGMVGINISDMGQGGGDADSFNINQGFSVQNLFQNLRKPPPIINTITISLKEAYEGLSKPIIINRWIANKDSKTYEDETIYLTIPKGVDDGEIIITREKGNILYPDSKGDIKTFIKIENDTAFKRHGLDLDYTQIITLKEALCGFSFVIEHINGVAYKINNSSGTIIHPSYKKTIPKKGMVRDGMEGNLNIHFIIEFPKALSKEALDQISKVL